MDWENLKYFLALSRTGSITQAAESLGVNYTTVARRLGQLEGELDTTLFDRLPGGIRLTSEGQALLHRAQVMESELNDLVDVLGGKNQAASGTIVLALSQNLASILMPCLRAFLAKYPAITIDLMVDAAAVDLEAREADIAVRCTNNPPESLVGKCVAATTIAPYARSGLIEQGISFGDLSAHPWIVWDEKRVGGETHKFNRDFIPQNSSKVLSVSDASAQINAVKEGVGLAWLWRYVGDTEAGIEVVSDDYPEYHSRLWVLMHKELSKSQRHRLLYEDITHYFANHPNFQTPSR